MNNKDGCEQLWKLRERFQDSRGVGACSKETWFRKEYSPRGGQVQLNGPAEKLVKKYTHRPPVTFLSVFSIASLRLEHLDEHVHRDF